MGTAFSRLLENDDGTVRLEGLFDLLRVLLRDALFEHLWHRLDKLLRLDRNEGFGYNGDKTRQSQKM